MKKNIQVEQISIFMENRSGQLAEITSALADINILIKAMILADISDFGVLRMVVDDPKKAKEFLKHQGYVVNSTPVFMLKQTESSKSIHDILNLINNAGINVEYLYAFKNNDENSSSMIFMVNDPEKTIQILHKYY